MDLDITAKRPAKVERQKLIGQIIELDGEIPPAFLEKLHDKQLKTLKAIIQQLIAKREEDLNKLVDKYYAPQTMNPVMAKMLGTPIPRVPGQKEVRR
jgi:hypothetical protein